MYKVKKKPHTPNIVWDAERKTLLCKFVNGIFETDNKRIADALKAKGHTVTSKSGK